MLAQNQSNQNHRLRNQLQRYRGCSPERSSLEQCARVTSHVRRHCLGSAVVQLPTRATPSAVDEGCWDVFSSSATLDEEGAEVSISASKPIEVEIREVEEDLQSNVMHPQRAQNRWDMLVFKSLPKWRQINTTKNHSSSRMKMTRNVNLHSNAGEMGLVHRRGGVIQSNKTSSLRD